MEYHDQDTVKPTNKCFNKRTKADKLRLNTLIHKEKNVEYGIIVNKNTVSNLASKLRNIVKESRIE